MLALILQRTTFFCLPNPGIEGKLTYEMEKILVPSLQLRKWCHEEFTQLEKVTSLRDGGALQGIPTVTLTSTCNTKARCLVLAKWGIGKPNNTRSLDTSTFGTTLKNQNRTKSIMGYFKLTLLYVNLTLQLKNTVLKTRETLHSQMLACFQEPSTVSPIVGFYCQTQFQNQIPPRNYHHSLATSQVSGWGLQLSAKDWYHIQYTVVRQLFKTFVWTSKNENAHIHTT